MHLQILSVSNMWVWVSVSMWVQVEVQQSGKFRCSCSQSQLTSSQTSTNLAVGKTSLGSCNVQSGATCGSLEEGCNHHWEPTCLLTAPHNSPGAPVHTVVSRPVQQPAPMLQMSFSHSSFAGMAALS